MGTRQSNRVSHLPDLPVADKLKQADVPEELTIHNLGSPTPNSHWKIELLFDMFCPSSLFIYDILQDQWLVNVHFTALLVADISRVAAFLP